jgi:hypothetical protein
MRSFGGTSTPTPAPSETKNDAVSAVSATRGSPSSSLASKVSSVGAPKPLVLSETSTS